MKESEQKAAAKKFAETWKNRGYEKGETHSFWIELLQTVYGVENPTHFIFFEEQVDLSQKRSACTHRTIQGPCDAAGRARPVHGRKPCSVSLCQWRSL